MLDLAAAVFIGNMLTALFLYGLMTASKSGKMTFGLFACCAFPLLFALFSIYPIAGPPPWLDALLPPAGR